MRIFCGILFGITVLWTTFLQAETIRVIGFNVESGGASSGKIAEQIGTMGSVDIWGFSEVRNLGWAMQFKAAAINATGSPYRFVFGNTGGGDRLVILYNQDKLEEIDSDELHEINPGGRVRSPLVVRFRVKGTDKQFLAVVNHLYRKRSDLRQQQAKQLREWAAEQELPVIALGDYNFDWESDASHGEGFTLMTQGDVFTWVRPENVFVNGDVLPTQCHHDFRSVLDFVFVSGEAQNWNGTSEILFSEPDYCPDDNLSSDHRPVEAIFTLMEDIAPIPAAADADPIEELREAVNALEQALVHVKERLAAIENP